MWIWRGEADGWGYLGREEENRVLGKLVQRDLSPFMFSLCYIENSFLFTTTNYMSTILLPPLLQS